MIHARDRTESSNQPIIREGYYRHQAVKWFTKPTFLFLLLSIGYVLCWEEDGQNETHVSQTLSNSTLAYKVTGLTSLTTYTLQVAAVTQAGTGAATSSTISTGLPPGLHTLKQTHTSMLASL